METTSNNKATVEAAKVNGVATDPMPYNITDGMTTTEADNSATQPSNPIISEHKDAATNKAVAKLQPETETKLKNQVPELSVADFEDIDSQVEQVSSNAKQQASGGDASRSAANGEDDAMDTDENPPEAPLPKSKAKGKARLQEIAVGEVPFESPVTKKEMLAFLDQHIIDAYPVKQIWIQIARKLLQNQGDLPLSKAQMLARLDKYATNAIKETLVYIEVARRLITSLKDNSVPNGKGNGEESTLKRKREAEVTQASQAGEVKRQKLTVKKSKENSETSQGESKQIEQEPKMSQEESVKEGQNEDDEEAQFRQSITWTSSAGRMNMQSGFPERRRSL